MKILIIVVTCLLIGIYSPIIAGIDAKTDSIAGIYDAVSESEWALTVELQKNGTAFIEVTTWEAGKYENRQTQKYKGQWKRNRDIVEISYNGITEKMIYSDQLSLADLGRSESAPGLKGQTKPWEPGVIGSVSLWRREVLKDLFK